MTLPRCIPLLLALLVACGTDDGDPTPVDAGSANYSAGLGDDPDFSLPDGRVTVETWFAYGETQLTGWFADGPDLRYHTEAAREGNCRLVTYEASTCDPTCDDDEACVDGACVAWPTRQDRGDLLWVWPDGERTVSPDGTLAYFATGQASTAGDISVTFEDTTLVAPTVEALEADGDWAEAIEGRAGGDATLSWTNPIQKARVRLHMTDCVGSHGGIAPAEIECEGPDTGTLVIPGTFLDALAAGDWSHGECGSHEFERYHAAAPPGDDSIRMESVADAGLFWRPGW